MAGLQVALFSGGKDSTLALLRARELTHGHLGGLVFTVPSFPFPSPHYENMACVARLARLMGLPLGVVRLPRGAEQEALAGHLRRWGATSVVAGDVLLDEHLLWHEEVARRAGMDLLEPLYNSPTSSLFWEAVERGIEFMIIACKPPCPQGLLGKLVNRDNARQVYEELVEAGVDPIGEMGEYHTLVTRVPGVPGALEVRVTGVRRRGVYGDYLHLDCSHPRGREGTVREGPRQPPGSQWGAP